MNPAQEAASDAPGQRSWHIDERFHTAHDNHSNAVRDAKRNTAYNLLKKI